MSKYRITRKELLQHKDNCRSVMQCELQYLLMNHVPVAYNCGTYGWNFDVYQIDDYYITSGCRQMVGKDAKNTKKYESMARKVYFDDSVPYEEKLKRIEDLLHEFVLQM